MKIITTSRVHRGNGVIEEQDVISEYELKQLIEGAIKAKYYGDYTQLVSFKLDLTFEGE